MTDMTTNIDYIAIYRDSDNSDEFVKKCLEQGGNVEEALNLFYELQAKYEDHDASPSWQQESSD